MVARNDFRSFIWWWGSSVLAGIIVIRSWLTGSSLTTGWQYLYDVNVAPIIRYPVPSFFIAIFPTLVLYVFFMFTVRVTKLSDDFKLAVALQEVQGLWLGVSLGFLFLFFSTATSSIASINQAQDTAAFFSFFIAFILYALKRRSIVQLHQRRK